MTSLSSSGALRRVPTRLVLVGGIHLALIWSLLSALGVHPSRVEPPTTTATVIDSMPPPTAKYTPVEHPLVDPIFVKTEVPPPPDFAISDLPTPTAVDPGPISQPPEPAVSLPEPVMSGAAVDPHHPLTQPAYPMSSIRNNEEGALSLAILIGIDGRVREAKVVQSSGSAKLDQAAINEAKTRWHLKPATRDGVAFEEWLTLRVVFRLEGR